MSYSVQLLDGQLPLLCRDIFSVHLLEFEFKDINLCMVNMMPTLKTLLSVCLLEFDYIKFDHCMDIMMSSLKKLFLYSSVNLATELLRFLWLI